MTQRGTALVWLAIVLVGGVLRFMQTVQSGFPLGDGGLFYAAIESIRQEGMLPQTIPYNDGIPFVYPPLGFLLAALPAGLFGTETVLRILPPVLATAVVAVMPWTASRFTGSMRAGLLAGAMVAVMPQTYDQLVAGGGVTRALGVLLALLAIGAAAGPGTGVRRGVATGALLGLTALAHPRVAIFALVSVAFAWWFRRREIGRGEAIGAAVSAAVVVGAWLLLIVSRGQLDALLAGGQRFDPVAGLVGLVAYPAMQTMHGGIPNVATALSLGGVAVLLLARRWALPAWLLVVHVLGCPEFVSPIAWAITGAAGLDLLLTRIPDVGLRGWRSAGAGVVILVLVAVMSAGASPAAPGSKQQPLLPEQVEASRTMAHLPDGARLAVVTSQTWGNDLVGEWLPALSGHVVITTPQGAEWLGVDRFEKHRQAHDAARDCHRLTSDCLASAIAESRLPATHVVIPRGSVGGPRAPDECCPALIDTIRDDSRFRVVADDPGALVLEWIP